MTIQCQESKLKSGNDDNPSREESGYDTPPPSIYQNYPRGNNIEASRHDEIDEKDQGPQNEGEHEEFPRWSTSAPAVYAYDEEQTPNVEQTRTPNANQNNISEKRTNQAPDNKYEEKKTDDIAHNEVGTHNAINNREFNGNSRDTFDSSTMVDLVTGDSMGIRNTASTSTSTASRGVGAPSSRTRSARSGGGGGGAVRTSYDDSTSTPAHTNANAANLHQIPERHEMAQTARGSISNNRRNMTNAQGAARAGHWRNNYNNTTTTTNARSNKAAAAAAAEATMGDEEQSSHSTTNMGRRAGSGWKHDSEIEQGRSNDDRERQGREQMPIKSSLWEIMAPRGRSKRVAVQKQLYKSTLCKFHLQGSCVRGANCMHAHSPTDLQPAPDLTSTSLCKNFVFYGHCDDRRCRFAHSRKELNTSGAFYRTKLCAFQRLGECRSGVSCRFAHSEDDLEKARQETSGNNTVMYRGNVDEENVNEEYDRRQATPNMDFLYHPLAQNANEEGRFPTSQGQGKGQGKGSGKGSGKDQGKGKEANVSHASPRVLPDDNITNETPYHEYPPPHQQMYVQPALPTLYVPVHALVTGPPVLLPLNSNPNVDARSFIPVSTAAAGQGQGYYHRPTDNNNMSLPPQENAIQLMNPHHNLYGGGIPSGGDMGTPRGHVPGPMGQGLHYSQITTNATLMPMGGLMNPGMSTTTTSAMPTTTLGNGFTSYMPTQFAAGPYIMGAYSSSGPPMQTAPPPHMGCTAPHEGWEAAPHSLPVQMGNNQNAPYGYNRGEVKQFSRGSE